MVANNVNVLNALDCTVKKWFGWYILGYVYFTIIKQRNWETNKRDYYVPTTECKHVRIFCYIIF